MRLCFLPANIDAAGCLRCLFPARELRKLGHTAAMCPHVIHRQADGTCVVEFAAYARDGKAIRRIALDEFLPQIKADIYVFQMPLDRGVHELIKILQDSGAKVVCEADDDHIGVPAYNPAFEGTDPKLYPDRNRDWLFKCFQQADAMSVSTPFLKERYGHLNDDITVVPNYLDWEMWADVQPQYEVERRRTRVGWMGQRLWRQGDLQVLRGVIGPWLERNPEVEFVAAGDPTVHDFLGVPKEQRVTTSPIHFTMLPNSDAQGQMFVNARLPLYLHRLPDITAVMDIGLVPLEMNPFNEAKSALKGMEYAACGIPCVASPTESYRTWEEATESCRLAKRPKDWIRLLDELVQEDETRRALGRQARETAQEFTIQKHVGEWGSFYERMCSDGVVAVPVGAAA